MRGGSQSHLLRADDGYCYVVKSPGNPQGSRTLANEYIANCVLGRVGINSPVLKFIQIDSEFIQLNDMHFQLANKKVVLSAGVHLGLSYPGDPARTAVYDFLPAVMLTRVSNLAHFIGVLVCDKWLSNTDARQAMFFREPSDSGDQRNEKGNTSFTAVMIDNGQILNGSHWKFVDSHRLCSYISPEVYSGVRGWSDFDPWFARINEFRDGDLERVSLSVPDEWIAGQTAELQRIVQQLEYRIGQLPRLIEDMHRCCKPTPFINWNSAL